MYPLIEFSVFKIYTYGICLISGFALAIISGMIRAKKRYTPIRFDDMITITAFTLFSSLAGGYILYVLVEYLKTGIFSPLQNGIVFYGGLAGGIFGAILSLKALKINIQDFEESFVPFIPLGHAVGRIGCLLAGCCYGREYYGPLAIYYPEANRFDPMVGHFPVQPLEAFLDIIIMLILLAYLRKKRKQLDTLFLYLTLYSAMRFCTEMLRGDINRGVFAAGLSTSQLISLGIVLICIARTIALKYIEKFRKQC